MPMRCPYCGSVVEPASDTSGALFCPACQNTGKVTPAWPPPASAGIVVPGTAREAAPTPGKAVAGLVLGICAVLMAPLGLVLGPIAIVLGWQARVALKRAPAVTSGNGLALAGIVLGVVGVVLSLGALAYILADGLLPDAGAEDEGVQMGFEVDADGTGGVLRLAHVERLAPSSSWSDYQLEGTAQCRLPSGAIDVGDEIVCVTDGDVLLQDWGDGRILFSATV